MYCCTTHSHIAQFITGENKTKLVLAVEKKNQSHHVRMHHFGKFIRIICGIRGRKGHWTYVRVSY